MPRLTYHTAGESHGPGMLTIVQGLPADMDLDVAAIDAELARRQGGYGRGARQRIETDRVEILAGVRNGRTIGSPLAIRIVNRDCRMDDAQRTPPVYRPRPGHADLPGAVKWLTTDCRGTLERASARETAARVAAGATARCFLQQFDITVFGFVRSVHQARWSGEVRQEDHQTLLRARNKSDVYCPDQPASEAIREAIRTAKIHKDTAGGLVETHVFGCPIGLGSSVDHRLRLDARIAAAVMGIQAFKGVEIGLGMACTQRFGSEVHDPIQYHEASRATPSLGFRRPCNNAGGLEGGMTNGQPVVVRGAMKPIATILRGMPSVDLNTKEPDESQYERSDVCAVSAASVVMENAVAFEVADAFLDKFGGDSMLEIGGNYKNYLQLAAGLPLEPPTGPVIASAGE